MNEKILRIAAFVMAISVYTSCNKNDTSNPTPIPTQDSATIMGFKDSTQLIKSLTSYYMDSGSNVITDSSSAVFHYDTIKRRIIIVPGTVEAADNYDSIVFQYNSNLLLISLTNMFSTPPTDPTVYASLTYTYDGDNVIQSATYAQYNGNKYTYSFVKTTLPGGGYQLSWLDTSPYVVAGITYLASFNNQGQMISNYSSATSDSLEYDASGNTSKVVRTVYVNPYDLNGSQTYTLYDFTSRDTKGDQLYNLYQALYHGIANLNVEDGNIGTDLFNVEYIYQFSKYPATSTIINRPTTQYGYCPTCGVYPFTSTATPAYDSQNRLVKYKVFFNDTELSYEEFHISYYK